MKFRYICLVVCLLVSCSTPDRSDISTQNTGKQNKHLTTSSKSEQNYIRSSNNSSGIGDILSFLVEGIFFFAVGGSIFWLYKRTEDLNSSLKFELKQLKRKNKDLSEKQLKLKRELDKYKSHVKKLVKKMSAHSDPPEKKDPSKKRGAEGSNVIRGKNNVIEEFERKKKEPNSTPPLRNDKTLFFSGPEQSGKFNHGKGDQEPSDKKIYSITFDPGEHTGQLAYHSSSYDGQVINHKDTMLKPVCKILEAEEGSYTKVKMKTPGTVRREGNQWIVEEKIEIEII